MKWNGFFVYFTWECRVAVNCRDEFAFAQISLVHQSARGAIDISINFHRRSPGAVSDSGRIEAPVGAHQPTHVVDERIEKAVFHQNALNSVIVRYFRNDIRILRSRFTAKTLCWGTSGRPSRTSGARFLAEWTAWLRTDWSRVAGGCNRTKRLMVDKWNLIIRYIYLNMVCELPFFDPPAACWNPNERVNGPWRRKIWREQWGEKKVIS